MNRTLSLIIGSAVASIVTLAGGGAAFAEPSSDWTPPYPTPVAVGDTLTVNVIADPGCTVTMAEIHPGATPLVLTLEDNSVVATYPVGTPLPLSIPVDPAWGGHTLYASTFYGNYVQDCTAIGGEINGYKYPMVESKWDVALEATTPVMPPVAAVAASLGALGFVGVRRRRNRDIDQQLVAQ
jgi:hypothetical protein